MTVLWLIPIGIVIGIGIWYLMRCKAKAKAIARPLTFSVDIPASVYDATAFALTPNGITTRSTSPVPPEALAAIDRGFTHTAINSKHYNPDWVTGYDPTQAQVFLIPKMATNVETDPGSPALLVKFLDAGGNIESIQSAGTCIGVAGAALWGVTDPRVPSIIICEQSDTNWSHLPYLEEAVRNEFEHIFEWLNNKAMFQTFAIVGDVHPHFPDW